jgi:hypothetical protein
MQLQLKILQPLGVNCRAAGGNEQWMGGVVGAVCTAGALTAEE